MAPSALDALAKDKYCSGRDPASLLLRDPEPINGCAAGGSSHFAPLAS